MITISQTYAGNFIVPPPIQNLRSKGVPPGGPADPFLSKIALHLAQSDTCLEITSPITLTTEEPTQIALAAPQNSRALPNHPTASIALVPLLPGEPLTIQAPQSGFRLYLSWPGLKCPSRFPQPIAPSTKLPSDSIQTPKFLAFNSSLTIPPETDLFYLPIQVTDVKVSPSSEEWRGWGGVEIKCQTTPHISRIGSRLEDCPSTREGRGWGGVEELFVNLPPLPRSEPSLQGAIQITPDNQLLIHGPDGPTLGGYPKLGAIIQASLPAFAQLRPNQAITLKACTVEEAHQARLNYQTQLAQTIAKIDQALSIALQ